MYILGMTLTTAPGRVEIDFAVYNPFDMAFMTDPIPVLERLLNEYPVAFHKDIGAWMVSPHDLAAFVLRSPKFSTKMTDWNNYRPSRLGADTLYDQVHKLSMTNVGPEEHMRLRRLTAPAFSRRVMDKIEASIRDSVTGIFDEIENPGLFDAATDIATKVPIRSIARMVGVPSEAESLFEHGLGWNLNRAQDPMHAADRDTYIEGSLPGLRYLLDVIVEHRKAADPGDDFIGTLITTEIDGEHLSDLEILSVIMALVTAGADTAVDLHTLAIKALLTNPDQRALLRQRPELMEATIIEVLRWSAHGKFGAIPRFPLADIELGGQVLETGSFVMPMLAPSWVDPAKWPEPHRFDVTRNHSGNIVFGAGPHLCIGLNLVKVQGKLMIEEFERRFGGSAEMVGELEYDSMHFNARRITKMMIKTGAS
jgi:cytochrome P450